MSHIDLEGFQRLEEFPSFISCIHSFGRPIIPPLVTPNHVHELRELRAAAISKEIEILRRKRDHLDKIKDDHTLSMLLKNDQKSDFQPSVQDSCALWYPSYFDRQEVSVAISKFPTSGIYSSVHTDAIVCSDVVGSNHPYNSNITKGVLLDAGSNVGDCVECSHSNINLECSLCLAELNQNLCNKSFPADLSPEVPCRTFSLVQHGNANATERELNATVEEAECESLPTVICNQKNLQPDTDSESNTTCMTQSTDLEKYMELSCEFSSPDNSAFMWDSKTASQQCTLSRSDDASSETIVNTENELTPCASTMAELTDNIEDEFSNAEEVAGVSDNKEVITGEMKRAHSVDSYMKILQNCGKSLNVKKSQSEPFNASKISTDINDVKTILTLKTNLLIKEDSKESEEAKDVPEKDECTQRCVEISTKEENVLEPEGNKKISFQKKHIRQNSYTLDYPSSALIEAHADCTCNFDAKCISPHCSALKDTSEVISNSAFVKEKVDISASPPKMKMLPVLNSDKTSKDFHWSNEEMYSTVVDIFPNVNEEHCEKSDSGNAKKSMNMCTIGTEEDSKVDVAESLGKSLLDTLNLSNQPKHLEYIQRICEDLKVSHEMRVKELREQQNQQWLQLEEEFKQQEQLLYEKLLAFESSRSLPSNNEDNLLESNLNASKDVKKSEERCISQNEPPACNSHVSLSDKFPTSDNSSSTQTSALSIPNKCSPSSFSSSEISVLPENARALSPSKECMSSDNIPSIPPENIKTNQPLKNSDILVTRLKSIEDPACITNNSVSEVNGFSHPTSFVPRYNSLPEYRSAIAVPIYDNCDKIATCFCDNTFQPCRCCTSFNGCSEYEIINSSSPPYLLSAREHNSSSFSNNADTHSSSIAFKKQSSSGIHNEYMDSVNFNTSSRNMVKLPSKSNDCILTSHNGIEMASLKNEELPTVQQHDKDQIKSLPVSMKQKYPVDSLVTLYSKTSDNGSCILLDGTLNKKVNADPILLKKFKKLPAFVKGYLTRRLLKTDHVQNLIKTFKDTALLIGKMREDLPSKGDAISQGDIDFQRQLIVLLMTTYDNFYDTFFTISIKEQMNIIAESRNSKLKHKSMDQDQEITTPVTSLPSESTSGKPCKLSSATLKVLERKKRPNITIDSRTYNVEDLRKARSRSVLDMRTYTIDDLPSFRGRAQSSMSSKGISVSPSSIYKSSVGLKRKTASAKSSGSKGCVHQKWVP